MTNTTRTTEKESVWWRLYSGIGSNLSWLQGYAWALTIIALLVGGFYVAVAHRVHAYAMEEPFFALSGVLVVLLCIISVYLFSLRAQRKELRELHNEAMLEAGTAVSLQKSNASIDAFIVGTLRAKNQRLSVNDRRRRCIDAVLTACRDNILPLISPADMRVAFLDVVEGDHPFALVSGKNLAAETEEDILQLTLDASLAGCAVKTKKQQYIPDVRNQADARSKYYAWLQPEPRHLSIVAHPVIHHYDVIGVIIVDSVQVDAFSQADLEMLAQFERKIRLIESIFPRQRDQTYQQAVRSKGKPTVAGSVQGRTKER